MQWIYDSKTRLQTIMFLKLGSQADTNYLLVMTNEQLRRKLTLVFVSQIYDLGGKTTI
jgi:hypothetical protein